MCRTAEMLPSVPGNMSAVDTVIRRSSRTAGMSGNVLVRYSRVAASCFSSLAANTMASGCSFARDSRVMVAAKKSENAS